MSTSFIYFGNRDINRDCFDFVRAYRIKYPDDIVKTLSNRLVKINDVMVEFIARLDNLDGFSRDYYYISAYSFLYQRTEFIRSEMARRFCCEIKKYDDFIDMIHLVATNAAAKETGFCSEKFVSAPRRWYIPNNRTIANDRLEIKDVIFNGPATIVFWKDGTKTVVKCQDGDLFNPETGIAMAIVKKMFGNKSNFNNVFKPWVEKYYNETDEECEVAKALTHLMDGYFKLFNIKADAQEGEQNND